MRIDSGEDAVQLRITGLEVLGTPSRAAHGPCGPGLESRAHSARGRVEKSYRIVPLTLAHSWARSRSLRGFVQGPLRSFSVLYMHPPHPGFAWRNGLLGLRTDAVRAAESA